MSETIVVGGDAAPGSRGEGPGAQIGSYKLLQEIGSGGFGTVYEADQEQPVRRRVALKIIKLGMDTREVIARFDAERQALALMDHPHIARVLDAGTTDSGRPYFVMELVRGEPITQYCDKHKLSVDQRLALFEQVCLAVQHAHTKGVIHRDLKPSNLLVSTQDNGPFAKVIDFGIAKAVSGRLTDRTLFTEMHQLVGTPLYMSPEQAEGSADIDTRTDIYSLGVILYELLTGANPLDATSLRGAALAEMQRIIREVEPPRPSARVTQRNEPSTLDAAARRGLEPPRLRRELKGDLDWIVMKAIDKERTRRYETANGLAMDLRRHLNRQPVIAAPPSTSYRVGKFVRRHRVGVAASTVVVAALIAAVFSFAEQARTAKRHAEDMAAVSGFQARMLQEIDQTQAGKGLASDVLAQYDAALAELKLPEAERQARHDAFVAQWAHVNSTDAAIGVIDATILRPALATLDKDFADRPLLAAELRQALADQYTSLGLHDAALPVQQEALAIRRKLLGDADPKTQYSVFSLGVLLNEMDRSDEAEAVLRPAVDQLRRHPGEDRQIPVQLISALGIAIDQQGRYEEALPYYEEALAGFRREFGDRATETLEQLNNMGFLMDDLGRMDEALRYYQESLAGERAVLGNEDESTLTTVSNVGSVYEKLGRYAEAEPYYRESLEGSRRALGSEHPDSLISGNLLGRTLVKLGRLDEAEALLVPTLASRRRILGDRHGSTLKSIGAVTTLYIAQGRFDEAEALAREALAAKKAAGETDEDLLPTLRDLAKIRTGQGHAAEAVALLAPLEPTARKLYADDQIHWLVNFLTVLGEARAAAGDFTGADKTLGEANALLSKATDPSGGFSHDLYQALAALHRAWDKAEPKGGHRAAAAQWEGKAAAVGIRAGAGK
jgi:serine/threonine protein kinase/tetratricopeptide (TPR) repeat protein